MTVPMMMSKPRNVHTGLSASGQDHDEHDGSSEEDTDSARLLPSLLGTTVDDVDVRKTPRAHQKPAGEMSGLAKKWAALTLLTVQGVVAITLMHYTHVRPKAPGTVEYASSSVVALAEVVKLLVSGGILLKQNGCAGTRASLHDVFVEDPMDTFWVSILALCYVVSNNLILFATGHLAVGILLVLGQTKLFASALFTRLMLKREIKGLQWVALGFLFFGVVSTEYTRRIQGASAKEEKSSSTIPRSGNGLVQLTSTPSHGRGLQSHTHDMIGVVAILAASMVSSFGGVFFEKILKSHKDANNQSRSLWLRNLQLSAVSMPFAFTNWLWSDHLAIKEHGLFHGYDAVVCILPLLSAFGGLVFACVIKYADNILKGFASSAAIILGVFVDVMFFQQPFNGSFYLSVAIVVFSIVLYSR